MAEVNVAAEMCDERASCAVAAVDLDGRPRHFGQQNQEGLAKNPSWARRSSLPSVENWITVRSAIDF